MKGIIRRILFKNHPVKEYFGVSVPSSRIESNAILVFDSNIFDISSRHCIVCLDPVQVLVWIEDSATTDVSPELHILKCGKKKSMLLLQHSKTLTENGVNFMLFEVKKARVYTLGLIHQYLISKYFNRPAGKDFHYTSILAALFSFPRKVIIVSFQNASYYNIFPMDFQGSVGSNMYVLGLRNTNLTLQKMLEEKKVVVADSGGAKIDWIYNLGKNHSSNPPLINDLPFTVLESKVYKFPVPSFVSSYKEIEIIRSVVIGSHTLMIGMVKNDEIIKPLSSNIYHVHSFEFLNGDYTQAK